MPEVSYGTHFFQDLVEAQIIYLPVYPDDEAAEFQAEFFKAAPNVLLELLPHAGEYESVLRLIDVPQATGRRVCPGGCRSATPPGRMFFG